MPKLIILVGLPGSGKTYYLNRLSQMEDIRSDRIWDDYHARSLDNTHAIDQSRHFADAVTL
jgi:tRNA uridine 5-carbamoylmethylation protein Kti12